MPPEIAQQFYGVTDQVLYDSTKFDPFCLGLIAYYMYNGGLPDKDYTNVISNIVHKATVN